MTWPMVPLGDLCSPKQWPTLSKAQMSEDGHVVYGANGPIGFSDKVTHRARTILIGCRGSCGSVHVMPAMSYANGNAMALDRLNEHKVHLEYLALFLRMRGFKDVVTGSSQPQIIRSNIVRIKIPLPSLNEQRRIAAILDKADALRRKRKRALELLDGLTQAAFADRFGLIDDLVSRNDLSHFGDLVDDGRIGLVRSADELSTCPGQTPYVRMDAISIDGRLSLSPIRYTKTNASEQSIYELKDGDFLFNTRNSRDLVGKTAIYNGPPGYVYNNNILRIRFKRNIEPNYIQFFFQTRAAKRELEARKAGTTSVFAIYQKTLYGMPVVTPPIADQRAFTEQVRKIVEHRKRQEQYLIAADLLFASLQDRAFSGQL